MKIIRRCHFAATFLVPDRVSAGGSRRLSEYETGGSRGDRGRGGGRLVSRVNAQTDFGLENLMQKG